MADQEVRIRIRADDAASGAFTKLGARVISLNQALELGRKAWGFLKATIGSSISAAVEAQNVQAQLGAVLKSTGGVAGVTAQAALDLSKKLQGLTTFGDEAILSAENLLLTFTKIGQDIFPEATQTVLDMSTALGQDLKSSAIQLGKALQDPILGVVALRRVGVNFNEAQTEVIKNLVETGHAAEAQRLILKELATEFGGSATAKAATFGGQVEQVKNQLNDMKEEIGLRLIPSLRTLLTTFVQNNSVMGVGTSIGSMLGRVFHNITDAAILAASGVGKFLLGLQALDVKMQQFFFTRKNEIKLGLDDRLVALGQDAEALDQWRNEALSASAEAQRGIDEAIGAYMELGQQGAASLGGLGESTKKTVEELKKLTEEITSITDKIVELQVDNAKESLSIRQAYADAYVKQEEKIADLTQQINDETDFAKREQLKSELKREQDVLASRKNIETAYQADVDSLRDYYSRTDFERVLIDLEKRQATAAIEFTGKLEQLQKELEAKQTQAEELIKVEKVITVEAVAASAERTTAVVGDLNKQIGKYNELYSAARRAFSVAGPMSLAPNMSRLPGRQAGGAVPGPFLGAAVPILAHAGEEIVPIGGAQRRSGGGINIVINNPFFLDRSSVSRIGQQLMAMLKEQVRV